MIQSSTDYLILVCFAHEDMKKNTLRRSLLKVELYFTKKPLCRTVYLNLDQ